MIKEIDLPKDIRVILCEAGGGEAEGSTESVDQQLKKNGEVKVVAGTLMSLRATLLNGARKPLGKSSQNVWSCEMTLSVGGDASPVKVLKGKHSVDNQSGGDSFSTNTSIAHRASTRLPFAWNGSGERMKRPPSRP
eukprot:CAMPEP_0171782770 /NCGR_PEP_ID=MMETSP0991-20121206/61077_1 /TAXON_ID=483369 /ORGANISM="non described non described, Strain CCMP2098" /LENGTH=135 /DNA_ID=CAMNT_0012390743 /DNA_START=111 /DNA_END=515 /DNA_ORIENTATION=-